MKVITFCTPGPYEQEAKGLIESGKKFGIDVHVDLVTHVNGWLEAVCWKPHYILFQLQQLGRFDEGDGVLWTDADSHFVAAPDWSIFNKCDISMHRFRWTPGHSDEVLTGTMFFRNRPQVKDFVKDWCRATATWAKANRDTPEQLALKETLEADQLEQSKLRWLDLPVEYIWIKPDFDEGNRYPGKNPVIEHYQASRRYKR